MFQVLWDHQLDAETGAEELRVAGIRGRPGAP